MSRRSSLAALALVLVLPAMSCSKKKQEAAEPAATAEAPAETPAMSNTAKADAPTTATEASTQAAMTVEPGVVVEYRETLMEGMAKHMKMSGMVVKGAIDRKADLVGHARALHAASQSIPDLFPEGTGPDAIKSESKPEIWTDRDGFLAANTTYAEATAKLVEVAESGDFDAFKAQFGQVGKSCGGCHDGYRVDDEH